MNIYIGKGEAECSDRTFGSEKPDLVSTEERLQMDSLLFLSALILMILT
jgi:hypothetical protein